ncbi:MAG TPA: restriction endonuclease fold toxin-2 domain-containing protein [Myxococcaceae bacterium]|nr:restriction endonuclease fold toxin-2 domain-containing protein [Myxococcaceae bacterium]
MRLLLVCLGLLLAAPASANSLEDSLCGSASTPVAQMAASQKLCRGFVLGLQGAPEAMAGEAQALLTPENLATMASLTAVWLGSQGVPILGQAVDAALVTLGVVLLAAQAADLAQALWHYANLATGAQSRAALEAAGAHLARAISVAGINVVTFILTKKVASRLQQPRPPSRSLQPATSSGALRTSSTSRHLGASGAPVVEATGPRQPASLSPRRGSPTKVPNSKAFASWVKEAPKRAVRQDKDEFRFQASQAGKEEYLLRGGGEQVWVDGVRRSDAHLLEVKFVMNPGGSPFIQGSSCSEGVRLAIREKELAQFRRYAAILKDPDTPAVGLEVITNEARAVPFFESILQELGIPGRVVVRQ